VAGQQSLESSTKDTDLWGHELGGSTKRAGRRSVPHIFFAETIVGDLDVSVESEKNIVKLEVTVNHTVLMEVL